MCSDLSLRPVRVVTDVELSGDGEKRGTIILQPGAAVSALLAVLRSRS